MPADKPTSWAELQLIREAVKSYQAWRKANQLDPDTLWIPKIRDHLETQGYQPKRQKLPVDGTPEKP